MDFRVAYKEVKCIHRILYGNDITLGETVKTGTRGRVHNFPYVPSDPVGLNRTYKQTREHARKAHL